MSDPLAVLAKIRSAGGSVEAQGSELKVVAPVGLLGDQDRATLAKYKPDLLRLLAPASTPRPRFREILDRLADMQPASYEPKRDSEAWDRLFAPVELALEAGDGIEIKASFERLLEGAENLFERFAEAEAKAWLEALPEASARLWLDAWNFP